MAYAYDIPKKSDLAHLTPQHKKNLAKLAAKLRTVTPKMFNMAVFFENDRLTAFARNPDSVTSKDYSPACGTVACACGWGPAAGIKALPHEGWTKYAARNFGSERAAGGDYGGHETPIWNYLFDEDQGGTPLMAARRIETLLRHAG